MVYLLATASALANALTSILQRMGVEDAPDDTTLRLSLLTHALKRGVWLIGFAVMVASFLFQAVALHLGDLSQVQPILTTELLFLIIILATWFRFRIGMREWLGCLAAAGGLTGFLLFAQPSAGNSVPTARGWIVVGSICGAIAVLAVILALRGPRWWRAAMFGAAGAVGFAFTAALIKTVGDIAASDWVQLFVHWQTYALAVCGVVSLFLAQNAFHAGPIAASQTALVLVDPLASLAIGISLFGDNLRTAGAYGPLEALSLLVMFAGAASIAHSPLISGMKGDDDRYSEMLSLRSRSKRLMEAVQDQVPLAAIENLPPDVIENLPPDVIENLPPDVIEHLPNRMIERLPTE
jgi:drug/metabolite transporter (DMT)-like permease